MEDSDQRVLDQIVDLELAARTPDEIAASYRALCAMILARTATVTRHHVRPRKSEATQKRTAIEWMRGGTGLITFEAACEAMEVAPDAARGALERYAEGRPDDPINKRVPQSGRSPNSFIFGKPRHADHAHREAPSRSGMVACNPDGHRHSVRQAGPGPRPRYGPAA